MIGRDAGMGKRGGRRRGTKSRSALPPTRCRMARIVATVAARAFTDLCHHQDGGI